MPAPIPTCLPVRPLGVAAALLMTTLGPIATAEATGLTLNGAGTGAGFTLTTAIGGFSYSTPNDYTLVSLGVSSTGNLIAPSNVGNVTYLFPDVDNQTIASNIGSQSLPGGPGFAMATYGNQVYGSQGIGGGFYDFNANGSIGAAITVVGATSWFGLWANPVNGRLLASATIISSGLQELIDIDPSNGSYNIITLPTGSFADGVTVTPDGTVAYIADYPFDRILGFSLVTAGPYVYGQMVYNSGFLGHGSDGMGVLSGTCAIAGQIVVNNNDGTVGLINPAGGGETVIAGGGTRGDYASLDTSNGTLFLSQNEQVARLTAPDGCTIGVATTEPTPSPEPAGLSLAGAASLAAAMLWSRRRRRAGGLPA